MSKGFVEVYSKRTGRKYLKPAHYLDNPRLMAPFRLTPSFRGGSLQEPVAAGTVVTSTTGDDDSTTPTDLDTDPADAD